MKRVLFTGATGLVGARAVSDLLAANYAVVAVSRNAARLNRLRSLADSERLALIPCDLVDPIEVSKLADHIGGVDVLIHLGNDSPADPSDHKACTGQVVASTNLICAVGSRIDYAIVGSCTSVYGDGAEVVPEDHPTYPSTYYGASQLAGEQLWNLFSVHTGKSVACLRFNAPALQAVRSAQTRDPLKPGNEAIIAEASRVILTMLSAPTSVTINVHPKLHDASHG